MSEPTEDIAELMSRDPLSLSNQDIITIVEKLRSQRARFVAGNNKAGTPASRKSKNTEKQEKALSIVGDLDLGDL